MKKDKLEILFEKIDDKHTSSFWYDEAIARYGKYLLIATGEINVQFKKDETMYCDGNALQEAVEKKYTDKDLQLVEKRGGYWENNNWFEVIGDEPEDYMLGDVAYDYDEAIELLKQYHREDVYAQKSSCSVPILNENIKVE